ncbi:MAG: threonine/serine dehydratase [Candidatus Hodarchaeales archaeon]
MKDKTNAKASRLIDVKNEVLEAEKRIRSYIRETPLEFSPGLSKENGCKVYLKLENLQHTGSFKVRGAFNKILSIPNQKEVVTASSGNHGLAVAYALHTLGGTGTIYLPSTTARVKIEKLKDYNVNIENFGSDCVETEVFARNIGDHSDEKEFISPYNDPKIIGGQGTIAVELQRQLTGINAIFVAVGGGGLISGIAGYLKEYNPNIEIVACLPENSAVMYESIKAKKIIEMNIRPTLSDGTAGGIEPGAITFELCQRYVDHFILVTEEKIRKAMIFMLEKHHMVVEGAAGVAIAAFQQDYKRYKGKNVVLIICGGNLGFHQLKELICDLNGS